MSLLRFPPFPASILEVQTWILVAINTSTNPATNVIVVHRGECVSGVERLCSRRAKYNRVSGVGERGIGTIKIDVVSASFYHTDIPVAISLASDKLDRASN